MLGLFFWCLVFLGFMRLIMVAKRPLYPTNKESAFVKKQKVPKTINPLIEVEVLSSLEEFEKDKKYLQKDMTVGRMAELLGTNTKYVTWIIAKHRGKRMIDYIIDLKTAHIIHLLESEKKYRNYTNKALADEAGFGSAQYFAKVFKEKTGESPTDFAGKL